MIDSLHLNYPFLPEFDIEPITRALKRSEVVIVPTDTVYGLVAEAFDTTTFDKLDLIKRDRSAPYTVMFSSVDELLEWYGKLDFRRRRIIHNLLPGPITLILPLSDNRYKRFRYADRIGIRVSSDQLIPELILRTGQPLWATSANKPKEHAPYDIKGISSELLDLIDVRIDGGSTPYRQASTVIDLCDTPFKVLREGPWLERAVKSLSYDDSFFNVLVVCTGNICRSPLGAALLQMLVGKPEDSGIQVASAGTGAVNGQTATPTMANIGRNWGVDLSHHQSRQGSADMILAADLILTMNPMHSLHINTVEPHSLHKTRLFAEPLGESSIPDPFQGTIDEYKKIAAMIRMAAEKWTDEIPNYL